MDECRFEQTTQFRTLGRAHRIPETGHPFIEADDGR